MLGKIIDKIKRMIFGTKLILPEQLQKIEPKLSFVRCQEMTDLLNELCPKYGMDSIDRFEEFLANVLQESGAFTHKVEDMNYTAKRITQVWPSRFKTIQDALPFARNPVALANKVYGGRMGNTDPNDGWTYRGGGFIGLTGKEVYGLYAAYIAKPTAEAAELVRTTDRYALDSACWFFAKLKGLIDEAERDEFIKIVKAINGGTIGLNVREDYYKRVKAVLRP